MAAGSSRWLVWIGGIAALGVLLVLSLVLRVQQNDSKAWPIAHAVIERLATEQGARDLYAKNPRLGDSYATADAFVAAMAAQRGAFGALPARRPDGGAFQVESDPESLRVYAKGDGGGWMQLEVERSDGSAEGHAAIGEGITYLGFAKDEAGLETLRKSLREVRDEARWGRFRSVEQALLTDEGVRALLQSNPDFAKEDAAKAAFLKQAQDWRPRLAAAPPPETWKGAVDSEEEMVSMQRRSDPFGTRLTIGWRLKDKGAWLRVEWKDDRLHNISLGD
ncbi:MAG: hypothetical protein JST05_01530 [Acidobacteria bacterium]|nr:hypothetical protein [Acidobacteriota bacterium]